MRVIGGSRRGMKLRTAPGRDTRPTADRVKEALFNIIAADVPGARVLDLFAGSGALGIEALSRGASAAIFVERAPQALAALRANLAHTRLQEAATVVAGDVFRALNKLARSGARFDLVLADPPYAAALGARCLQELAAGDLVEPEGLVVLEHAAQEDMPEDVENLRRIRSARYGGTALTFYRRRPPNAEQGGDG